MNGMNCQQGTGSLIVEVERFLVEHESIHCQTDPMPPSHLNLQMFHPQCPEFDFLVDKDI